MVTLTAFDASSRVRSLFGHFLFCLALLITSSPAAKPHTERINETHKSRRTSKKSTDRYLVAVHLHSFFILDQNRPESVPYSLSSIFTEVFRVIMCDQLIVYKGISTARFGLTTRSSCATSIVRGVLFYHYHTVQHRQDIRDDIRGAVSRVLWRAALEIQQSPIHACLRYLAVIRPRLAGLQGAY